MLRKLKGRGGVTLTELLVAITLLGLLSAAVVTGVGACLRVYRSSVSLSRAQTALSTLSAAIGDEVRLAKDITLDGDELKEYTSARTNLTGALSVDAEGQLRSGEELLVGDGVYSGKSLRITDLQLTCGEGVFHLKLTVEGDGGVSVSCETDFRWLNDQN